jgi:hypothetical protein
VQHFIHHLAPHGMAGFVLANGSMSSNQSGEGDIRRALIEADLVDCMVALPGQLFYSTQIPVCLWFLSKNKNRRVIERGKDLPECLRDRRRETLFIDGRKMGTLNKNVAAELLIKLLGDEIKLRSKRNLVQSQEFSEMLKNTLNAYHNRAIATQEIIEELIQLAKQMSAANQRGVDLGLNDDEVAFYDALAANDSAVEAMGKDELKVIAAELVTQVRKSVTIDWTLRESARAKIKVLVRRILRKHGYPPDLQDEATKLVLAQAELLCAGWSEPVFA